MEEQNASSVKVCYGTQNEYLWLGGKADWSYLKQILHKNTQINLVHIRIEDGVYMPELIIYEPDYLIDITAVASCFETYAESPYVHLLNMLKPPPNTVHIHLGNLAGQFLDETIHNKHTSFNESIIDFFHHNAISLTSCEDLKDTQTVARFYSDARQQQQNIANLIGKVLPQEVKEFDTRAVVLEPTISIPTAPNRKRSTSCSSRSIAPCSTTSSASVPTSCATSCSSTQSILRDWYR